MTSFGFCSINAAGRRLFPLGIHLEATGLLLGFALVYSQPENDTFFMSAVSGASTGGEG